MDSLTHIAIGACLGEGFVGNRIGKKAMLWGILAHSLPDIDIVAAFWMPLTNELIAHRGFTHSILFVILISPVLAIIAKRFHKGRISFTSWLLFFLLATGLHIFLDAFNNYGTGWFEPFSHTRISFNTVYVVDPLFSIWSVIALAVLIFTSFKNKIRGFIWKFGLIMTTFYLGYCCVNKLIIDAAFRNELKRKNITENKYFTTPAPLQNWLWFVVAKQDSGFYTGYKSVFHPNRKDTLSYFPQNNKLLNEYKNDEDVKNLKRFSQGFYTVSNYHDTLVFNDLRFGQQAGWFEPHANFAFYFYLKDSADNSVVVQRGRFKGINKRSLKVFKQKIFNK